LSGVGRFTGFLSRVGRERGPEGEPRPEAAAPTPPPSAEPDRLVSTKALRKFVAALRQCPSPTLLDLGPVVGSNIQYFGEQLGCKVIVEDVFEALDRFDREDRLAELAPFLESRFPQARLSVDGILCWDLFDFLDRRSAQVAAAHMMRVLKPNGALFGMFSTEHPVEARFTRFVVVDDETLRHRPYAKPRMRQAVMQNRDLSQLFGQLRVSDLFLLQTKVREILFRKPGYLFNP
jgi:hypothetical protein